MENSSWSTCSLIVMPIGLIRNKIQKLMRMAWRWTMIHRPSIWTMLSVGGIGISCLLTNRNISSRKLISMSILVRLVALHTRQALMYLILSRLSQPSRMLRFSTIKVMQWQRRKVSVPCSARRITSATIQVTCWPSIWIARKTGTTGIALSREQALIPTMVTVMSRPTDWIRINIRILRTRTTTLKVLPLDLNLQLRQVSMASESIRSVRSFLRRCMMTIPIPLVPEHLRIRPRWNVHTSLRRAMAISWLVMPFLHRTMATYLLQKRQNMKRRWSAPIRFS